MFLEVIFDKSSISALLDTGSSINLMSQDLFNSIPRKYKYNVSSCNENIVLANNQPVNISCTAGVSATVNGCIQTFDVYVLDQTSHPLILGTDYLKRNGTVLNFDKMSVSDSRSLIHSQQKLSLSPNSETVVWGKIPQHMNAGSQGICTGSAHVSKKGLMVARSIAFVSNTHMVPLKILNPTSDTITIYKNKPLGSFQFTDKTFTVSPVENSGHLSSPLQQHKQTYQTDRLATRHTCSNVNVNFGHRSIQEHADSVDRDKLLSYFQINSQHLSSAEKCQLEECLYRNNDLFVTDENPSLGLTSVVEHQIHLIPNAQSKHQRPYRLSPEKREVLRHQLDELLRQGIITPVSEKEDVPISSPIVLVSKRSKPKSGVTPGSKEASLSMYRFCVDFRYLNSQTQDFRYAIPHVDELTESFTHRTPNYISSIDLSSGFFQMGISPESSKYTAFNTCFGTYKFQRLPQGLKTSPNSFQMLMDKILNGLSFRSTLCYLDDVLIFSETFEQHLSDLQEVFNRFREAGMKLSPSKCTFAQESCLFLGHELSRFGMRPPADRLQAVSDYPVPKTAKQLKRYLGLMNWFRTYIRNYSATANCLYRLLRKGTSFLWQKEHQRAFDKLKEALLSSEALAFPNYNLPFHLAVDTSSQGIGYMLYQLHPSKMDDSETPRVVRFGSKSLSNYQRSYGPTKLELLGVVTSVLDCASYLRGRKFYVECDHQALKPLFQKSLKGAIYERWLAILQEFNFEINYKSAAQMVVPDSLSRCRPAKNTDSAESSPDENDPYFPYVNEEIGKITFPDGTCLQEVIGTGQQNKQAVNHILLPPPTSLYLHNEAYDADSEIPQTKQGHKLGDSPLNRKRKLSRSATKVTFSDCDLSADEQSMTRAYAAFEHRNTDWSHTADTCTQHTITQQNNTADSQNKSDMTSHNKETTDISQQGSTDSSLEEGPFNKSARNIDLFKSFDFSLEKVQELQRTDSLLGPMIVYLETNVLPKSQKKARKLLLESSDYTLLDGLLFHSHVSKSLRSRNINQYQLVLPEIMIKTVLGLYHDSPMSGHAGIHDTLDRVKEHYFFHRMGPIITDYVRSCPDCQKRKQTKHHTKSTITAYRTPSGPFQVWQVDLYGPLPVTTQGFSFVLTAVDFFSKYLVTIPLANKDTITVAAGLTQLFTKYGVCETLISDRGSEFVSKCMSEVCRQLCIPQEFTPAFVHKCLGAAERVHRTLAERLTPYVQKRRNNWIDFLSPVTFSINQSVHSSTGYSPHEVIFAERPKFPLTPPKPTDFDTIPVDMRTYIRKHTEILNVIRTELKTNALKSQQNIQDRANKDSSPLHIKKGDYVYLLTERTGTGQKLQNKYTGPFVIDRFTSPHLVLLRNPETGTIQKSSVHLDRLKMAYVRQPNPSSYFLGKVVTCENGQHHDPEPLSPNVQAKNNMAELSDRQSAVPRDDTDHPGQLTVRRSSRTRKLPDRYGVALDSIPSDGTTTDNKDYHKTKRVLGQRTIDGTNQYLIQFAGEPAENALWLPLSNLNEKLRKSVQEKPPPVIVQIE